MLARQPPHRDDRPAAAPSFWASVRRMLCLPGQTGDMGEKADVPSTLPSCLPGNCGVPRLHCYTVRTAIIADHLSRHEKPFVTLACEVGVLARTGCYAEMHTGHQRDRLSHSTYPYPRGSAPSCLLSPPSLFGGSSTVHVPYHAIHSPFVPDAVLWAQIRIPLCISHLPLLPPRVRKPTISSYVPAPTVGRPPSVSHFPPRSRPGTPHPNPSHKKKKNTDARRKRVQHNRSKQLRFQLICKLCPMTNRCRVEHAVAEHGFVYRV